MEKRTKATVAGILNIITGALGVIWAICCFIGFGIVGGGLGIPTGDIPEFVPSIVLSIAIFTLIIAIPALVGGAFAVQRKQWGWSLAGSITALIVFLPLGIASTVLVAQSRDEFK